MNPRTQWSFWPVGRNRRSGKNHLPHVMKASGTIGFLVLTEFFVHGCKILFLITESASSHLEWRLSFSLAEILLARSLTAVQRQCYLLVKNLIKDLKCNVIPSYYIKCSFFWLLEDTETNVWRSSNLGNCVLMALNKPEK